MGHKKKEYVGGVNSEVEAAKIYDKISIKANGLKVNIYYCFKTTGKNKFWLFKGRVTGADK